MLGDALEATFQRMEASARVRNLKPQELEMVRRAARMPQALKIKQVLADRGFMPQQDFRLGSASGA
jgi:hypothetical protein